jgi:hypothetical protein
VADASDEALSAGLEAPSLEADALDVASLLAAELSAALEAAVVAAALVVPALSSDDEQAANVRAAAANPAIQATDALLDLVREVIAVIAFHGTRIAGEPAERPDRSGTLEAEPPGTQDLACGFVADRFDRLAPFPWPGLAR